MAPQIPIRTLLLDTSSSTPRYIRLHSASYTSRDLLAETLSMANRILRSIPSSILEGTEEGHDGCSSASASGDANQTWARNQDGSGRSSTERNSSERDGKWATREIASKWDSIRAYPEMLQGIDVELLKILVLDGYADEERVKVAMRAE